MILLEDISPGFAWFGISAADWIIALTGAVAVTFASRGYFKLIKDTLNQRRASALQQFDSTFFNLISNHSQLVGSIREPWNFDLHSDEKLGGKLPWEKIMSGREIFKKVACTIHEIYHAEEKQFKQQSLNIDANREKYLREDPLYILKYDYSKKQQDIKKLNYIFDEFYKRYRSAFSHYFRNLFHIIKFIDEYEGFIGLFDKRDETKIKYGYIKIIRAQLSTYELILLWYNSMQNFGAEFKKYIKDYKLLKNIDDSAEIVLYEELEKQYPNIRD